jgi:hypothetical protein
VGRGTPFIEAHSTGQNGRSDGSAHAHGQRTARRAPMAEHAAGEGAGGWVSAGGLPERPSRSGRWLVALSFVRAGAGAVPQQRPTGGGVVVAVGGPGAGEGGSA